MTCEGVIEAGQPAFCCLESGALLIYDPEAGDMKILAHSPSSPDHKRLASYAGFVPPSGWTHLAGCLCCDCAAEES